MKAAVLIFLILSLSYIFSETSTAEIIDGEMVSDGIKRTYHLFVPDRKQDNSKLAMVIVLHGGGSDGQSIMRYTRFNDLAEQENFLVLYPNGYQRNWNDGRSPASVNNQINDVRFISVLIDEMVNRHRADSSKVFATGISNGAIFSLFLASQIPAKLSAIAVVCGSIPSNYANNYATSISISVMIINGTEDPLIPYGGGPVISEKSDRGDVIATDSMVKKFAHSMNCDTFQTTEFPDINLKDQSTATKYSYLCSPGSRQLILIKVMGGGHTWPGGRQYLPRSIIGNVCRDFNATSEIWRFFKST